MTMATNPNLDHKLNQFDTRLSGYKNKSADSPNPVMTKPVIRLAPFICISVNLPLSRSRMPVSIIHHSDEPMNTPNTQTDADK